MNNGNAYQTNNWKSTWTTHIRIMMFGENSCVLRLQQLDMMLHSSLLLFFLCVCIKLRSWLASFASTVQRWFWYCACYYGIFGTTSIFFSTLFQWNPKIITWNFNLFDSLRIEWLLYSVWKRFYFVSYPIHQLTAVTLTEIKFSYHTLNSDF